jgi:D-alanine-D-alanine ligase
VPAVLEQLGIPFSGSDPFTLAVTLDKDCAKKLVAAAGVAVPPGLALAPDAPISSIGKAKLAYPVVVKPAWEGSSKGIRNRSLVKNADQAAEVAASLRKQHAQTILLEEYIAGEEVTVALIGNEPPSVFGMLHVSPKVKTEHFLYSLEHKREYERLTAYQCPPPLPDATLKAIAQAAQTVFRVLGCRDVARIDFRVRDGVPFFLEVNPLPGLHPDDSDLAMIARLIGFPYERLVSTIVNEALKRCGL